MLLFKSEDWPVGQRFPGQLYTQFSLARYNMHRLTWLYVTLLIKLIIVCIVNLFMYAVV